MGESLRVLLVTDSMPGGGGSETYAGWVRAGLTAAGDEVRLLTSSTGTAGDGTADFVAFGTRRVAAQAVLQIANPFAAWTARSAARSFRPDIALVHLFAYHLSPAVMWPLRHIPVVMMILDYKIVCPLGSKLLPTGRLCEQRAGLVCLRSGCLTFPHWLRDQVRYACIAPAVRQTSLILACSRHLQSVLRANGICSEHLPLPVTRPGSSYARGPAPFPEFMFCGRLSPEKSVPLLLRAFARVHAQIPDARLKIVGDGPQRVEIDAQIAAAGLDQSIVITGWLDPPGVERQFESAWGLVAPATWAEPFGLVALEAIVRGVPVIACSTGGFGETVDHEISGLLFPNGDEDALYGSMMRVATGDAFPSHSLEAAVVNRAARTFDVDRHISILRTHLLRTVGRGD